jgi:hypothetical protein
MFHNPASLQAVARRLGLVVIIVLWPPYAFADPNWLQGSYVVVREAKAKKQPKNQCVVRGKVTFKGRKDLAPGLSLEAVQGLADPGGGLVADDVIEARITIDPSGSFSIVGPKKLPLIVSAWAPDYELALVVLDTCNVSLDFRLALEPKRTP